MRLQLVRSCLLESILEDSTCSGRLGDIDAEALELAMLLHKEPQALQVIARVWHWLSPERRRSSDRIKALKFLFRNMTKITPSTNILDPVVNQLQSAMPHIKKVCDC